MEEIFTYGVFQVKRSADPDYVSNEALRSMCDSVLSLLSTTVENMDQVIFIYQILTLVCMYVCMCVSEHLYSTFF